MTTPATPAPPAASSSALPAIAGLALQREYVPAAEHDALLAAIDQQPWLTDLRRRVQHYGYRYDYSRKRADASMALGPLPAWLAPLAARQVRDGLMPRAPDQAIGNEYTPGQGISAHVDAPESFGRVVVSLTLGAGCVMELRDTVDETARHAIWLAPRSLLVLADDARYRYRHAIPARQRDTVDGMVRPRGRRVSLTFRTLRGAE